MNHDDADNFHRKWNNVVGLVRRLQNCLEKYDFRAMCVKPKQIKCWEYLVMEKSDVIGIFPTGFGKSLIFQLLPDMCSSSETKIVVVVCPLNSLIQDQMSFLQSLGISCGMLKYEDGKEICADDGASDSDDSDNDGEDSGELICGDDVRGGKCKIVFGHPEAFLFSNGRKLLLDNLTSADPLSDTN